MLKAIAASSFTAPMVDNSHEIVPIGTHRSTMTLYCEEGKHYSIEWDIPSLGETYQIGLWFDTDKTLTDYDGVYDLPKEAIALIKQAGFIVPDDF